jgi:hypothetical protein
LVCADATAVHSYSTDAQAALLIVCPLACGTCTGAEHHAPMLIVRPQSRCAVPAPPLPCHREAS